MTTCRRPSVSDDGWNLLHNTPSSKLTLVRPGAISVGREDLVKLRLQAKEFYLAILFSQQCVATVQLNNESSNPHKCKTLSCECILAAELYIF